ncbi:MAG: hypothetical protein IJW36_02710 [Clostridia bacterium]|nr:hypothetical protein [Clostridia bacterium]
MENQQNIIKASEVAARWWANFLGTAKQNNGDDLASLLLGWVSVTNAPNLETVEKFYETLKNELIQRFEFSDSIILSTDYGPEGILAQVAKKFEISGYAFPCKTVMYISDCTVSVRSGYQAKEKLLYSSEDLKVDSNLDV